MIYGELLDFRWHVHEGGYQWVAAKARRLIGKVELRGRFLTDGRPKELAGRGARKYDPSQAANSALFRVFADTPPTEEGVLCFAEKYGRLGGPYELEVLVPGEQVSLPAEEWVVVMGELLEAWHQEIVDMREAIAIWDMVRNEDLRGLSRLFRWEKPKTVFFQSDPLLHPRRGSPEVDEALVKLREAKIEKLQRVGGEPDSLPKVASTSWEIPVEASIHFSWGDLIRPALYYVQSVINERLRDLAVPFLVWDSDWSSLRFRITPSSLQGALWLQFALAVAGNKHFERCRQCGDHFLLDPKTTRGDRQYCSDACRSKAYRTRIAEARRLYLEGMPLTEIAKQLGSDVRTVKGWVDDRSSSTRREGTE